MFSDPELCQKHNCSNKLTNLNYVTFIMIYGIVQELTFS